MNLMFPMAPSDSARVLAVLKIRHSALIQLVAFTIFLAAAAVVHAQSRFEDDFDDKDKPWQEIAGQLPPAPAPENLLQFYVSPTATQTFFVDSKSLTIGPDGVVRYTLVSKSRNGAENVSYEGIRCASLEKKLYAFGQKNGAWSRSRRDQWEPITGNMANRQHSALVKDYFCEATTIAGNTEDILRRIRTNQTLSPQFK